MSISIFYSVDKNCYELALVSMTSIMQNTKEKIRFYILHSNLSLGFQLVLTTIKKFDNCEIVFKEIDEKVFANFQLNEKIKLPAWYRILIPDITTDSKAIYLDCDTIVRHNIKELFDIDLENNLLAGVSDIYALKTRTKKVKFSNYINTGVLLFNCNLWKKENIVMTLFKYISENPDIVYCGIQDTVNVITNNRIKSLSQKYNYIDTWWLNHYHEYKGADIEEYIKASKDPFIVHYAVSKPNNPRNSCHPYFGDWWKYAKETSVYKRILEKYKLEADKILYNHNIEFYQNMYPNFFNI